MQVQSRWSDNIKMGLK